MIKINRYDCFLNEGIRDKMTPKSDEDVDEALSKYFRDAKSDGSVYIDAGFYFDIWEELSEKYRVFDNYYAYNGTIYFLYVSTNEYDNNYQLSCSHDSVENFKKTLEKAVEKLNTL